MTNNETLPTKLRNKLVKITGERPVINCYLNDAKVKGLWDTEPIVSLSGKKCLFQILSDVSILLLEQFMGALDLNLGRVNNTSVSIESVTFIDFTLKPNTEKIKPPFLITSESVEDLIFGYNLIEHLVTSKNDPKAFDTLSMLFWYNVSITAYFFQRDRNLSVDYSKGC